MKEAGGAPLVWSINPCPAPRSRSARKAYGRGAGAHERRRRRSRRARATSRSRRRCWRARPPRCATWPRSAATCSAHAAPTSATRPRPCQRAPGAAAARSRAITACTRSSAAASAASPRTLGSRGRPGRARRRGPGGGARRRAADPDRGVPPAARQYAGARHRARAGRADPCGRDARQAPRRRSHYLKIRDRASFEFALVSVAAGLDGRRRHPRRAARGRRRRHQALAPA